MSFLSLSFLCIFSLLSSVLVQAQQPYVGRRTTDCDNTDNSSSINGYVCNGESRSCQAYLIFRSQFPYNTATSISDLLSSSRDQISEINAVPAGSTIETDREVIVPVNCSCSGQQYQANTSFVLGQDDTYFVTANNTYQGLSTCQALQNQNNFSTRSLVLGTRITVPLRCACPTRNQTNEGVNYLLSYPVVFGDFVSSISEKFGVELGSTLQANELSLQEASIYPFTTLIVPLQSPPNSQTIVPSPPPPPSVSPPPPPPTPSSGKNRTWIYAVVGAVCGGALVSIVTIIVFCMCFRKGKSKSNTNKGAEDPILDSKSFENYEKTNGDSVEESAEFLDSISDIAQSLKLYKFGELQSATENFSPKCLVKGSVYVGTINGSLAAIKKTNKDVATEISILNKFNHNNLIKLSGVAFSEGYWYLVFEYAVNGSLSDWIHNDRSTKRVLSWSERIHIALDVAAGLNYLHSYTNPPHVHKDLKTSNVLLDSDFRAKIANFSLARSADGEEGEFALTRHIVGTTGYMAPEYLENGYVSSKLDIYSFGIVILEIVTGKVATVASGARDLFSPDALRAILENKNPKEKLEDFIDPSLQGDYPLDLALLLARLIEGCIRREPADRPTMDDVVQSLTTILSATLSWEVSKNESLYESSEKSS